MLIREHGDPLCCIGYLWDRDSSLQYLSRLNHKIRAVCHSLLLLNGAIIHADPLNVLFIAIDDLND
tara:strand:+ start:1702 stop:1899 length:198 start_codon:yes stop_codon:yes gene_type:complete